METWMKKILAGLAAGALAMTLAACGPEEEDDSDQVWSGTDDYSVINE